MSLAAPGARHEKIGLGKARVRQRPGTAQAWPGDPPDRRLSMSNWEVKVVRHPLVGYLIWALLFGAWCRR